MRPLMFGLMVGVVVAGCGGGAASPAAPTPVSTATVAGTWVGTGADSSSGGTAGNMMGASGLGTMTWQLEESGTTVTGSVGFSGMPGGMTGTFKGTMDADDMPFAIDMPMGAMMMSGACSAKVTGTAHLDRAAMTMTATYGGSNSCSGAFNDGRMSMTHR